jgi:hypothetical protein
VFDSFILNAKTGLFQLDLNTIELEKLGGGHKSPGVLKDISACLFTFISELAKHDVDINSVRYKL